MKKFIATLLMLTMLMSLFGCANNESNPSETLSDNTTSEPSIENLYKLNIIDAPELDEIADIAEKNENLSSNEVTYKLPVVVDGYEKLTGKLIYVYRDGKEYQRYLSCDAIFFEATQIGETFTKDSFKIADEEQFINTYTEMSNLLEEMMKKYNYISTTYYHLIDDKMRYTTVNSDNVPDILEISKEMVNRDETNLTSVTFSFQVGPNIIIVQYQIGDLQPDPQMGKVGRKMTVLIHV